MLKPFQISVGHLYNFLWESSIQFTSIFIDWIKFGGNIFWILISCQMYSWQEFFFPLCRLYFQSNCFLCYLGKLFSSHTIPFVILGIISSATGIPSRKSMPIPLSCSILPMLCSGNSSCRSVLVRSPWQVLLSFCKRTSIEKTSLPHCPVEHFLD